MIADTHELIPGRPDSGLLIVADHASSRVPEGLDLGICPTVLDRHVAIDIGVEPLVRLLAARLEATRSEEHTSELQSLMRISYAVFCLKTKTTQYKQQHKNNYKHVK